MRVPIVTRTTPYLPTHDRARLNHLAGRRAIARDAVARADASRWAPTAAAAPVAVAA